METRSSSETHILRTLILRRTSTAIRTFVYREVYETLHCRYSRNRSLRHSILGDSKIGKGRPALVRRMLSPSVAWRYASSALRSELNSLLLRPRWIVPTWLSVVNVSLVLRSFSRRSKCDLRMPMMRRPRSRPRSPWRGDRCSVEQ